VSPPSTATIARAAKRKQQVSVFERHEVQAAITKSSVAVVQKLTSNHKGSKTLKLARDTVEVGLASDEVIKEVGSCTKFCLALYGWKDAGAVKRINNAMAMNTAIIADNLSIYFDWLQSHFDHRLNANGVSNRTC
jgi:hypothetical protein